MSVRESIYIEGFQHKNPVPHTCRVGNMLMSGACVAQACQIVSGVSAPSKRPCSHNTNTGQSRTRPAARSARSCS